MKRLNATGFSLLILLLMAIVLFSFASAGHYVLNKNNSSELNQQPKAITNFEECIEAGYGPPQRKDLHSGALGADKNIIYLCWGPEKGRTFTAESQKCSIGQCPDIEEALNKFCNDDYIKLNRLTQAKTLGLYYDEPTLVKYGYAHSTIRCYSDDDKEGHKQDPTTVFLHKQKSEWGVHLIIQDNFSCKEMDGKNIPLAIVGSCFDYNEGKLRTPR